MRMLDLLMFDFFMKWLKYDKNHLPTPLWYVPPEKKLFDGNLREIEIEDDLEAMIAQLGSMKDLDLYADGPINVFHFMNPFHEGNPPEADGPGKNIDEKSDDDVTTYNVTDSDYESEELELSRDDMKNEVESDPISETSVTMFKLVKDIKDIKFSIWLDFINKVLAIDAIRDYAVADEYNIRFKKSDSQRVRAKCIEGCKWEILISTWLVRHMTTVLMRDYSMGTAKVVEHIKHHLYVEITKNMALRVCVFFFDAIHDDYKQQYSRIRDYGVEIKRNNPRASVYLQTTLLYPQIY
ncbi:hypothetical protein ACFE04_003592 [Oxalis oulophora]